MSSEENTIGWYLIKLPEPYATLAMLNTKPETIHRHAASISHALRTAFNWAETKQQYEYWENLFNKLENE